MEIFAYLKRYSFFYFFIEIVRTFIVSPKDTAHMTVSRFAFFCAFRIALKSCCGH